MTASLTLSARPRSRAVVATATLLTALLVLAAIHLVRTMMLSNTRDWGMQLAQSYASEEESRLRTLEFMLDYGAGNLDTLISSGAPEGTLRARMASFAESSSAALDGTLVLPYLVTDDGVITADGDALAGASGLSDASWYRRAKDAAGDVVITDSYESDVRGERVFTVAVALPTTDAVLAADIPVDNTDGIGASLDLPSETSFFLFDTDGELIAGVTTVDLDSPVTEDYVARLREAVLAGRLDQSDATYAGINGTQRTIFYAELENGWLSVFTVPTQQILAGAWDPTVTAAALICGALIVIVAVLIAVIRVRAVRMRRVTDTLQILGNTFYAIFLVNHVRGTYETIKAAPDTARELGARGTYAHLHEVMRRFVEDRTFERFHESFSTESLRRLALEGVTEFGGEYRRRMDGSLHWVSVRAIADPTLGKDEMIVCFRLADAEVEQQNQTVELLQSSLEAARQSARSRRALFGSVSHDMRTPVNAIVGLARLLRSGDVPPERTDHYLGLLEDAGDQLAQLVDDVLDITHIESTEQGALDLGPVDLELVVTRTVDLFREQAREGEKTLEAHVDVDARWVVADPRRIRQVLNNLISNALKYSLAGARVDVTLEDAALPDAEARRTRVRVYRIVVADTGVGMPEDFLPKLFEPFAREEVFAPRGTKGTGLGMPIVKNLVQQMGGEIAVESELGRGTTFTLTIPFETAEPPAGAVEKDLPAGGGDVPSGPLATGRRILVAEDNEANTLIVLALLESLGAEVTAVANGREAVEAVRSSGRDAFDAVLMDMQMPVMDGCEAAREIVRLAPDLPVIAVTANAFAEDISRARGAGMSDYVTKPVSLESLSQALARAWSRP